MRALGWNKRNWQFQLRRIHTGTWQFFFNFGFLPEGRYPHSHRYCFYLDYTQNGWYLYLRGFNRDYFKRL